MKAQSRSRGLVLVSALFVSMAFAADHHMLNGTWKLVSAQGGPAIQGGTVTIYDREHNIYIARNFILTGGNETVNYSFSTDGQENSSIHEGKTTKTKAKWEGRELVVSVKQDTVTSTERFRLNPDGTLTLTVERPGTETTTLVFERRE